MKLTSNHIYNSIIQGAYSVIKNKETLNRINVFPVRDGDTGSNLASMMRTVIQESKMEKSIKSTLESIADAALYGARGNSGIIFAQYLSGLSQSVKDIETISIGDYALASTNAVQYAYNAIENPVEGTIITVMKEWGLALSEESKQEKSLLDMFSDAFVKIELALEKTKEQLDILKKANVVDSGAKGFTYFIEGALYYIKTGEQSIISDELIEDKDFLQLESHELGDSNEQYRYCTECLIESDGTSIEEIKTFLQQMGDSTVVASNRNKCRIHIHTNEPADIFDYLHERGTILYQKIDDMVSQKNIVSNRNSQIAIVTDSIADLPKSIIDKYQIHVVNLDILFEARTYMDKMTIRPKRLLEISKVSKNLPTSSQPSPKRIENLFDYLATYYDAALVLTVSKELSGTFNVFNKAAEKYKNHGLDIRVINTKQNSGAQGLLVKTCGELVEQGLDLSEIEKKLETQIENSKILVQVKNLDNMIKSGRLSVKAGYIGKKIGMKPIVTLDKDGKGALESIGFSEKGSKNRVLAHVRHILKSHKLISYAIVHVDNMKGALELAEELKSLIGYDPLYIEETSSIVAVGAGQGAVALSYLLEKEEM